MSVVGAAQKRTPVITRIVPGSMHDLRAMTVDDRFGGPLLLDLACYRGELFERILEAEGALVCRLKKDVNFLILEASDQRLVGRNT